VGQIERVGLSIPIVIAKSSIPGNVICTNVSGHYFWTKMEIKQAESLGQRESLRLTLYLFLLGELIVLFLTTSGDFANGILFFIQGHMNIHYLIMVTILFALTYLLGRRSGKEILIMGRHFFLTPFKYGLLTIWTALAYGSIIGLVKADRASMTISAMVRTFILEPYVRTTLVLIIPLSIYAYYCGTRIKAHEISSGKK
jgi:hypothetical protein